jgi:hypothetical protein
LSSRGVGGTILRLKERKQQNVPPTCPSLTIRPATLAESGSMDPSPQATDPLLGSGYPFLGVAHTFRAVGESVLGAADPVPGAGHPVRGADHPFRGAGRPLPTSCFGIGRKYGTSEVFV